MSDQDEEKLAALHAMTPEERRAHAKEWVESKPDWWREGLAEAKRLDPKGTRAAPDDPLVEFVKNARPATVPMTDDEKAALERYRSRSVMRRRAVEGDPVAAAMLEELATSKQ